MLAVVVKWPGENGSPSGADCFNGDNKEVNGPYVLAGGRYYNVQSIREFCRHAGIVLVDEVQSDFERMSADLVVLRAQNASLTEQAGAADSAHRETVAELEATQGELTVVREELDRTKTTAAVASEYLDAQTELAQVREELERLKSTAQKTKEKKS